MFALGRLPSLEYQTPGSYVAWTWTSIRLLEQTQDPDCGTMKKHVQLLQVNQELFWKVASKLDFISNLMSLISCNDASPVLVCVNLHTYVHMCNLKGCVTCVTKKTRSQTAKMQNMYILNNKAPIIGHNENWNALFHPQRKWLWHFHPKSKGLHSHSWSNESWKCQLVLTNRLMMDL